MLRPYQSKRAPINHIIITSIPPEKLEKNHIREKHIEIFHPSGNQIPLSLSLFLSGNQSV